MKSNFSVRAGLLAAASVIGLSGPASAQDEWFQDGFSWRTAGGRYLDPASFFSLHGYVNGVWANASAEWTTAGPGQLDAPGQLLVPNTNDASFQYDAAVVIGAEPDERTQVMIEAHFVTDPSARGAAGPGGLTIAFTEATASYALVPEHLRLSAGLFWAPFSTVNTDWLGAQNLFTLIPDAAAAFPVHFNERGVRVDGAFRVGDESGVNYVLSVGNGVSGFSIGDQPGYDQDGEPTVMGRVGIFPGFGRSVEVGISGASGTLRTEGDAALDPGDPERFPGRFSALGLDAQIALGRASFRTYGIWSRQALDPFQTVTPPDLDRKGLAAEVSYDVSLTDLPSGFTTIRPRARFDWYEADQLDGLGGADTPAGSRTLSAGLTLVGGSGLSIGGEYHFRSELGRADLDNDRLVLRMTAQF